MNKSDKISAIYDTGEDSGQRKRRRFQNRSMHKVVAEKTQPPSKGIGRKAEHERHSTLVHRKRPQQPVIANRGTNRIGLAGDCSAIAVAARGAHRFHRSDHFKNERTPA